MAPDNSSHADLIRALRNTLINLSENPYPHVSNPENCKKRASVALILRVRQSFHDDPARATPRSLEQFFEQEWVQRGDPEAIFIKRAARQGDRWTSHVALPGGKRDAEDADDRAVAIRETAEEIGLDLNSPNALFVGNLPERVVSTSWGKVPIMVLCPFVFLWTQPDVPPLKLQPNEVASTHWVPLRILLSPSSRTSEYTDVSDRFTRQGGPVMKTLVRSMVGHMRFSAIRLIPSESLFCSSTAEFFADDAPLSHTWHAQMRRWWFGSNAVSPETRPLLLWGLTLGMLADFLEQLPPHNAIELWSYPTFTTWDVRFIIHLLTRSLKRENEARLGVSQTAMDGETQALATNSDISSAGRRNEKVTPTLKGKNQTRSYAVGIMLEGYYDLARQGVWIATGVRVAVLAMAVYLVAPKLVSRYFQ
ncbi:Nudix [Glarea lozoyensis ATCC 20868]|uniref:Nudix n=1 Tax=Glarea lozoyensis (strain ATCC 20868 / MF5171) TaxID=1116229 RepID=S3CBX8_GLAL2|nr:Nudix [Glarea lozoyensis ATCC 20868]EPE24097.1 Nudix [Glarea lozoyensis ATCC 20868]